MFTDDPPEVNNEGRKLTIVEQGIGVQTPDLCPFSNCRKPSKEIIQGVYGPENATHKLWVRCWDCNGDWEMHFTLKEIGSIGG